MIVYTESTIKKLFVSPYTRIVIDDAGVHFYQSVFQSALDLNVPKPWGETLCRYLMEGITKKDLICHLTEIYTAEDSETVIDMMAGRGIIE